ncbi:chromodomain-helicase-DNA-binding protein 7-like [Brachyhypopomus gauderio]|uniref:chromodomain-helicase-DNA-binding protein 7-like n=1 Tax=Brachyhypopomus gauderio TaxID=698409 RepID=UPI004042427E
MPFRDDLDDFTNSPLDDKEEAMDVEGGEGPKLGENGKAGNLYWPPASALTARLRRLITAYQRSHKREQLRQEALTKPDGRRRRRHRDDILSMVTEGGAYGQEAAAAAAAAFLAEGGSFMKTSPFLPESAALLADGAAYFKERRQRWTRREEADFYRVVSTFGVVYDVQRQCFDWTQFRAFARLDKKTDESLEKYYYAFVAMCKRVCRMELKSDSAEMADPALIIDPITEERASRTLYRIELLRRIREQVLPHPQLQERLRACQPSPDLPAWWECGRHDLHLLRGAAKHGVSRTDYHILNDPELGFLEAHRKFTQGKGAEPPPTSTPPSPLSLVKEEELKEEPGEGAKVENGEEVKEDVEEEEGEKSETVSPKEEVKTEEDAEDLEVKKEEPMEEREDGKGQEGVMKTEDVQTAPGGGEWLSETQEGGALPTDTQPQEQHGTSSDLHGDSKPNTEKTSEEEEEEKMEEDDKSEKSSQADVGASSETKVFDEESNASLSTARDETRDYFGVDDGEPSASQMFSDRNAFSFWPKDRVMINRMDGICEAVIKGKWPSNRRQFFDFPGLLPGYGAMTTDSPLPRRGLGDLSMVSQTSYSGSEDLTMSPQVNKDEALGLSVPRQRRRRRRKVEIEAERAAKRRNLMEMVAQLRESHASEGQPQAVDLTRALHGLAPAATPSSTSSTSSFPGTMVSPATLKAQLELLQAGGASRPNGSLLEAELPTRRRRGRRKNVEGLELLFMGSKRGQSNTEDSNRTKAFADGAHVPGRAQRHIPAPAQKGSSTSPEEGGHLKGEEGPSTKDLREWLRQHPTYTMDMPGYIPKNEELLLSQLAKPKQKRHRCRNPNKIDINTLTGEERVPVVNKRNGRKMGGAMAPPMKDLPRWLVENPEFAISPDWTEIVKQSGFLPESMFDRLLTGPVVREEGVRRRGRRPKSEIAKAAAAAQAAASTSAGVNPLLMNGLFGGMDLTSLQSLQNLQSLQLAAGLMGFPPALGGAADSKHAAAMLPLMLPGMGGLPNMFGLGGLFGGNLAAAATAAATNSTAAAEQADDGAKPRKEQTKEEGSEKEEAEKEAEKSAEAESGEVNGDAALGAAAAGMSANPLAFNPFLLSTMAPGLFYPSMFLPPGLGGLGLPGFSPAALADLQNAMSGALGGTSEDKESTKQPSTNRDHNALTASGDTADNALEDSDSEESQNKAADSSALDEDLAGPAEELDSIEGGEEEEDDDEEPGEEDEDKSD